MNHSLVRHFDCSLETISNHLDFRISHACHAAFPQAEHYHNCYPENRLFLIEQTAADGGGEIAYRRVPGGSWQQLALQPDHAVLMPAHLEIRFHFARGLSLYAIHFRLGFLRGLDLFHQHEECLTRPLAAAVCRPLIRQAQTGRPELSGLLWAKGTLLSLIAPFLQGDLDRYTRHLRIYEKYRAVFDLMDGHPQLSLTVGDLARAAGMQPSTLSRNFQADTGTTLKRELIRRILLEAQRHLAETDLPMKQISVQLGFGSEPYFSRFIRKHCGQSPGQYRAMIRRNFSQTINPA